MPPSGTCCTPDTGGRGCRSALTFWLNASVTAYMDFSLVNSATAGSKMRLFPSGGLSVNSTTDPGAGIVNAATGFKLGGAEFPVASNGIVTRTAANTYSATGTTGSGSVVLDTGATMTNPVVGTQSASDNSTKAASTAYVTSAVSTSGGWTIYKVTSDFTTTNLTATDVTGLVTGTLAGNTLYEVEFVLYGQSTASSAGVKLAFHDGGSGGGGFVAIHAYVMGTNASTNVAAGVSAIDTLGQVFWTSGGVDLVGFGKGIFKTTATSPTLSLQVAKVTGGTATIHPGSLLKIRPL